MKILIGINCLTSVEQIAYANHLQFFYRLGKNHPDWTIAINTPRRMSIDRMRNMSAKAAVELGFDYLMFIDDDVIVPLDALEKLLACEADVAAGWTIIRGDPFEDMSFELRENGGIKNSKLERNSGIKEVDAVGFSCALIKVDLLKRVRHPWFATGPFNTEDIYFCLKAKDSFPETKIVVDTTIETAHILGPEVIAPWNKQAYKAYFDEVYGDKKSNLTGLDRNENYLKEVKDATA